MSNRTGRSMLVFGSGPGIGRAVAETFAQKRYDNIILLARRAEQLEQDKQAVLSAAGAQKVNVFTYPIDLSDLFKLQGLLLQLEQNHGMPELIFYNAARVAKSEILGANEEELYTDFRITNSALHIVARWALPHMVSLASSSGGDEAARPALLVTGSFLYKEPSPDVYILSVTKAAQRSMVQCLHLEFERQGVHVGLVSVGGYVGPQYVNRNAENIARVTWEFFEQERGKGDFEVEIVEPGQI